MKKLVVFLITLAVLGNIATVYAMNNARCPYDGNRGIWTGEVEVVDAEMYNVYRCPRGHEYLVDPY